MIAMRKLGSSAGIMYDIALFTIGMSLSITSVSYFIMSLSYKSNNIIFRYVSDMKDINECIM